MLDVMQPIRTARGLDIAVARQALGCRLQPIVDSRTGQLYGMEALLSGHAALGYDSPLTLLDAYAEAGLLEELEAHLHARAIAAFATALPDPRDRQVSLFLNIDGRVAADSAVNRLFARATQAMRAAGLPPSLLCWELSERHSLAEATDITPSLRAIRAQGQRVAADDFGRGYTHLPIIFDGQVDYLKIDRFYTAHADTDQRRRLFLHNLCRFAHLLNIRVIAEGVETEAELAVCRELGCDLVQGYFIARPTTEPGDIRPNYDLGAVPVDRRRSAPSPRASDGQALRTVLVPAPSILETATLEMAFETLRAHPETDLLVVLDQAGTPVGTIVETSLRPYAYNRYGRDLLSNRGAGQNLAGFIKPWPVSDIGQAVGDVLDSFMRQPSAAGVIVTEAGHYAGVLSAIALLRLASDRRTQEALDCNPLTKLPGNGVIAERIAQVAQTGAEANHHLVYLDLDYFKPFNDQKGFRIGDRAIMLLAEALKRWFPEQRDVLLGHLGGDDFVAVLTGFPSPDIRLRMEQLLSGYRDTVAGLFTAEERAQGFYDGVDREGRARRIPLLRCSAAVIEIAPGAAPTLPDYLDGAIGPAKALAKTYPDGLAWSHLPVT